MDSIEELLTRGVDRIYPNRESLEKVLKKKKITLFQGFDPTGSDLHIGHVVALRKLRKFQDLGHHVIFLIGDFTARIGDPTGKMNARRLLSEKDVRKNAEKYKEQAGKILNFGGKNPVEIKYNSQWLGKMSAIDFLQLSRNLTYQQIIERDMFQKRIEEGNDIYLNEFLYPFMQGYDSVAMNVDLEVGGTDQTFNMLMGRKLMRNILKKEKFVMTVPLLTDSNGVKIGKSEGNVIGLSDEPTDLYGKIMTLPDSSIANCFTLLTDESVEEIREIDNAIKNGANPVIFKKKLAFDLTRWLNSEREAEEAQEAFENTFQKREIPKDIKSLKVAGLSMPLLDLMFSTKLASSRSEAKRLISQGAVDANGVKIMDPSYKIELPATLKVGKSKFLRIEGK